MSNFIADVTLDQCLRTEYDLAIFASGYEQRASHLASQVSRSMVDRALVLGFPTLTETASRLTNDELFRSKWGDPITCNPDDDRAVFTALQQLDTSGQINVLVDYSSMSRDWYAAVLSWMATSDVRHSVYVDFAYSIGSRVSPGDPLPVETISAVAGFEGVSLKNRVALFLGLGFDSLAPFAILEQMEPSRVMAFIAAPGAADWYVAEALRVNADLIHEYIDDNRLLRLPLADLARSVSILTESAAPLLAHHRVAFVPMGPKPHILATLLTCLRLPEAGVLHVRSKRDRADLLEPTGDLVINRIAWPRELDEPVHLSRG